MFERSAEDSLSDSLARALWSEAETAVGNDGEDDISLYHVSTKSRTIRMSVSLIAAEIMGDWGYSGGRLWGGLCDHWDLIRTACQAAGVENAKG